MQQLLLFPLTGQFLFYLRTSCHQGLASLISFVLGEVLDKSLSQILGLCLPFRNIRIRIAGIQDIGIYTPEARWVLQC